MSAPKDEAKAGDGGGAAERQPDDAGAAAAKRPKQGPIICPGHSRPVPYLEYSKPGAGPYLLSACLDGKPMLRDGANGDWIGTFDGHKGAVWSAKFNTSATQVITASAEFNCKLWDGVTGEEVHTFMHKHIVKSVAFSRDSTHFYSGGHEKILRIFDLGNYNSAPEELRGHSKNITHILQCPTDEHRIISAAEEQNIRIWDRRTGEVVKECQTAGPVMWLEANGENPILVSTSKRFVQFWDTDKYELIKEFELPNTVKPDNPLNCAALDKNRRTFVTGSNDELWVYEWNYENGQEIGCQKGHHGPVRCIAFNPEGTAYASGSEDGSIRIWEL